MDTGDGLRALNLRVAHDLDCLAYPNKMWVPEKRDPSGREVSNVLIVGGGQTGLAVAFQLRRSGVDRVRVVDSQPQCREGPWITFARMETLRTRKDLIGLEAGIPSLTFRAWYEARFGAAGWDALDRIPRRTWMDYLLWFRNVLGLAVDNGCEVRGIAPAGGLLEVTVATGGRRETLLARKVVLATGIEGGGGRNIPALVADRLPGDLYAHTADAIDFGRLEGKRVGVLGAGASAFDNAAVALEEGAAEVHLFVRRPRIPSVTFFRWMDFNGFLQHFADLDDAGRWKIMGLVFRNSTPPPKDSVARVARHRNFHLHLGQPWTGARMVGERAEVTTPEGSFVFDFLILGTGFRSDLAARPELAGLARHVALWRHRYRPPMGLEHAALAELPYLGPSFELTQKEPGTAPFLGNVHFIGATSTLSMGPTGRVNGMKFGIPRLVAGITRDFYLEDADRFAETLRAFDMPDFKGHPWFADGPPRGT